MPEEPAAETAGGQRFYARAKDRAGVVFDTFFDWAKAHKKTVFIIVIFELWVHGLALHHLADALTMAKSIGEIVKAVTPL